MTKYIAKRNGSCEGYEFRKGEEVELPDLIAKALGERSLTPVAEAKKAPAAKKAKEVKAPAAKSEEK